MRHLTLVKKPEDKRSKNGRKHKELIDQLLEVIANEPRDYNEFMKISAEIMEISAQQTKDLELQMAENEIRMEGLADKVIALNNANELMGFFLESKGLEDEFLEFVEQQFTNTIQPLGSTLKGATTIYST